MRVAIIGSRNLEVRNLKNYLPRETSVIVSGGARGVDSSARSFATERGIPLMEFLPDYERYGRAAPIRRNIEIIESADLVLAFWDGWSRGTAFVIKECRQRGVPCRVFRKAV